MILFCAVLRFDTSQRSLHKRMSKNVDKEIRDKELNDLRYVLNDPAGRRFLYRMLGKWGLFKSSWALSAQIHFNEGVRNCSLELLSEICDASKDAFLLMMKENHDASDVTSV